MRSFVLVNLALFLGFLVTVAASRQLPLLPPLDHFQASTVESQSSDVPGIVSRLIRLYFGDQVRWRPFLQRHEQSAHHTHHRVVREYRPRPSLQSAGTTSKNVEMGSKPGHELGVQQFYLRGNPCASPLVRNVPQAVVEVPARQQIPAVELASQ